MFFFCLVVFLFTLWASSWWCFAAVSFVLGYLVQKVRVKLFQVAAAGAIAWAALAFVQDGISHGLISKRMTALLGLPSPFLIFLLMAVLGALTAVLAFRAGVSVRKLFLMQSKSKEG